MNSDSNKSISDYLRKICISGLFLFSIGLLQAQQDPGERIYQAYINDQVHEWEQVIMELTRSEQEISDNQNLDLIGYYYGFVGWSIKESRDKQAKKYIQEAMDLIDKLLEKYPDMPDLYAFKGAFFGFMIELNGVKAPVLGPKSMNNINYAIEIGPDNSQAWIEKGNALSHMPAMFGGSKEKAIDAYKQAITLMEGDSNMTSRNWMYLNVMLNLGQLYKETEMLEEAKATFDKALQIEPGLLIPGDISQ